MSNELTAAMVQSWMKHNPDLAEAARSNPEIAALLDGPDAESKAVPASKYHNVRAEAAGMSFQSGHEASVVMGLVKAEETGTGVHALRLQVRFLLPGGIVYTADAVYLDDHLRAHVVDAKAFDVKSGKYLLTKEFRMKRRLFRERYPGHDIELM